MSEGFVAVMNALATLWLQANYSGVPKGVQSRYIAPNGKPIVGMVQTYFAV